MDGINFEFGIISNNADAVKRLTAEQVLVGLDAVGLQAATLAKVELQKSPERIDTGLLRNSITHAVSGQPAAIDSYSADNESRYSGETPPDGHYEGSAPQAEDSKPFVLVGTNVEYAIYVHEGTETMTPNHFISNAIQNNGADFEGIMEQALNSLA